LPIKQKKQLHQEKRLAKNIQAAKQNRKDLKSTPKPIKQKKNGGLKAFLLEKLFGIKTAPQTAQQSIPYREMYKDGICHVKDNLYSKTIAFGDINYQLGATRSHTNTISRGIKLCGRSDHVVVKMGGFL